MRILLLVGLLACSDDTGDTEAPCTTAIRVCVTMEEGGAPLTTARVDYLEAGQLDPIEALVEADGCADLEVDAGPWEVRARTALGDCRSSYEAVEAVACQTPQLDVALIDWCLDG